MKTPFVTELPLPPELRELVFVRYRLELRRRIAQRRLGASRRRRLNSDLRAVFEFANGEATLVLACLGERL